MSLSDKVLPKPTKWQDFERLMRLLFSKVLNDPNTQGNGRQGQPQNGVDVYGYRDQDTSKLVGVQCKQKLDAEVTDDELEDELAKALNFTPPIVEFILVTTAQRDQKIQRKARKLTESQATTNRPVKVYVWGWQDIVEHTEQYEDVWLAFDPTYNPFAAHAHDIQMARHDSHDATLQQILSAVQATNQALASAGPVIDTERSNQDDTLLHGQLKALETIIDQRQPRAALIALTKLKTEQWATASPSERYRLMALMGMAHHRLGDEEEAGICLLGAADAHPAHAKAQLSRAKGYFLREKFAEALSVAQAALTTPELSPEAASLVVQCRYFLGQDADLLAGIPESVRDVPIFQAGILFCKRATDDPAWIDEALAAVAQHPEESLLREFAADARLSRFLSRYPNLTSGQQVAEADRDDLAKAASVLRETAEAVLEDGGKLSVHIAHNAALALRLTKDLAGAIRILDKAIEDHPAHEGVRLQRAAIARADDDYPSVLRILPDHPVDPEVTILRAEALAAERRDQDAIALIDALDLHKLPDGLRLAALAAKARALHQRGSDADARVCLDQAKADYPASMALDALRIRVYRLTSDSDTAARLLDEALSHVDPAESIAARIELASEARILDRLHGVIALLDGHVDTQDLNDPLMLLLSAAIEGNFPVKTREIFASLGPRAAATPEILRGKAVFALRVGDPEAEAAVRAYLNICPDDLAMVLARLAIWQRDGKETTIRSHLRAIDPAAFKASPEDLMRLANAMARYGRAADALPFAYRLLTSHWSNPAIHLRYHGIFLLNPDVATVMPTPATAGLDTVIHLVDTQSNTLRTYRIEREPPPAFAAEHVLPESDAARILTGKKVDDTFQMQPRLGATTWRVAAIKHVWLDTLHRSTNEFNDRFPASNELLTLSWDENAADPLIDIRAILKASAERTTQALEEYKTKPIPLLFIISIIGHDPIDTWLGIAANGVDIRTCLGTGPERHHILRLLQGYGAKGCVVDPVTLCLIKRLDVLGPVTAVCGPLHTAQDVMDLLHERHAEISHTVDRSQGIAAYRDGQLTYTEISAEHRQAIEKQRADELTWARQHVVVLPAIPARELSPETRTSVDLFGPPVANPAIAAQGAGLLLLSEDLGYRQWAHHALGLSTTWLQPVLMMAQRQGHLTEKAYCAATNALALAHHTYVSISPANLVYQFETDQWMVTADLEALLAILCGPNAEVATNFNVLTQAIQQLLRRNLSPSSVCPFVSAAFNAAVRGRGPDLRPPVLQIIQPLQKPPRWLLVHAYDWMIGHSMGQPYFTELLARRQNFKS